MRTERFTAQGALAGERLDRAVAAAVEGLTRTVAQQLCKQDRVLVEGKPAGKNTLLKPGDRVTVEIPDPAPQAAAPQDIPLDIVYEDDWLLVVNKPQGMVVHPAPGNPDGTLVNALLHHCAGSLSGIGGVIRPGIVHRIDKDTSGLLLVAKNDQAHLSLSAQIKAHSLLREYEAIIHGHVKEDAFTVNLPIGRDDRDRKKMRVTDHNAREAVTHVEVLEEYLGFSYVRCRLETGRTHQIRVHLAHLGHPVAGDPVYGPKKPAFGLGGQCLHARTIGFVHPATGEKLLFSSQLPAYFTTILDHLRKQP